MTMKVLVVARYKSFGYVPFIKEQVAALEKAGINIRFFPMRNKGIKGYLREISEFRRAIKSFKPDLIHAHYGLCGLFANLQRNIPVVTTFHGSDINLPSVRRLSKIAMRLSAFSIFVSQKMIDIAKPTKNFALVPCGINLEDYPIVEKSQARKQMGLKPDGKYVLFAGAFDNTVKNAPLAKAAVALLPEVKLLELKNYSRQQVALLMQAADAFIMTSHTEGSPQTIKEALACGTPIVSVDVGDVRERIKGVDGCYLAESNTEELSVALKKAIAYGKRTQGRTALINSMLTNDAIALRLADIYDQYCLK